MIRFSIPFIKSKFLVMVKWVRITSRIDFEYGRHTVCVRVWQLVNGLNRSTVCVLNNLQLHLCNLYFTLDSNKRGSFYVLITHFREKWLLNCLKDVRTWSLLHHPANFRRTFIYSFLTFDWNVIISTKGCLKRERDSFIRYSGIEIHTHAHVRATPVNSSSQKRNFNN